MCSRALIFFIITALFVTIHAACTQAEPNFETISAEEFNFGVVNEGQDVTYVYQFKNTGDEPLVISEVKSSCGCTAALLSSKEVAPGEVGEITATFDTSGRSGEQHKTIRLTTNDPDTDAFLYKLTGTIFVPYEITPKFLNFQQMKKGQVGATTISITNNTKKTVFVGTPDVPTRQLTVRMADTEIDPGESVEVNISFFAQEVVERFNHRIQFPILNGERELEETIKVMAFGVIKER